MNYEMVSFDQHQRDAIYEAIQTQKKVFANAISDDHLNLLHYLHDDCEDIIEHYARQMRYEINKLESVENYFYAMRLVK